MKQIWRWVRSFPNRYPWFWRNIPYAIILGIGLALVILAVIPQSACWAGCGPREKWCDSNCSQECYDKLRNVKISYGCRWDNSVRACRELFYVTTLDCPYSDNCLPDPWPIPVVTCIEQGVGICKKKQDFNNNTCCGGDGGSGGGGCKAEYAPPEILLDTLTVSPPYPLTLGQDPNDVGVTVSIDARGGKKTNSCDGPDRANITKFQVVSISLAQSSRTWITRDLAVWYPGAYVKGSYPMAPEWAQATNLNQKRATLTFHFSPLDPGYYIITVKAEQNKGSDKDTTAQLKVPVYLLETSIVK